VIECVCSDVVIHRERLDKRQRHIPGWHELRWSDVEDVQTYYAPWIDERLILDSLNPFEKNIQEALKYCS
jgi:hypothetical protein